MNYSILLSINKILVRQTKLKENTKEKCYQLMNYTAIHSNMFIQFCASNIILYTDRDTSYFMILKVKSRITEYYHLTDYPKTTPHLKLNRVILF